MYGYIVRAVNVIVAETRRVPGVATECIYICIILSPTITIIIIVYTRVG